MAASPRFQSSDAVTLLLSLVPYLIDMSPVPVSETAANFGVDEKLIREFVERLSTFGVPDKNGVIYSDYMFDIDYDQFYDDDVISLTHTVAIERTPRLSAREAATLLAGLSLISSAVSSQQRASIDELVRKIGLGTSTSPAGISVSSQHAPAALGVVREALNAGVHVRFDYRGSDGVLASRLVDPIRLESVSGTWYLRGYCHLRDDVRTFRVDRLIDIELDSTPGDSPVGEHELPETLFAVSDTDIIAQLQGPSWAISALSDFAPRIISQSSDESIIEINFGSLESVFRAVSRRPGSIQVISPESVRRQVADWAQAEL
jgi:proteasome accessory factor C